MKGALEHSHKVKLVTLRELPEIRDWSDLEKAH